MSQSKTAVPLCQTLRWVFHKVRCLAQYFFFCDICNVHATVNREPVGVDNWLKANRLSLNVSKTSYMINFNQKNAIDIRIRHAILIRELIQRID